MTIELRPLGVVCNLACHYCYQNPQRDAENQRMTYDLEKMKAAAMLGGSPFTLFGGEPLLMRFDDLENLFAWGLKTFGSNTVQSNGILIEGRHIDMFRRNKVSVGISIDGPGELNDARWNRNVEKTRHSTAQVEGVIARLCKEYQAPGLIVTLHKGNATADKLPVMFEWMRNLDALGIKGVRLHLLEVDHESVRETLALSPQENVDALLAFARLEESLVGLRFDLFEEMEKLLNGQDGKAGCTWRACDAYTTAAVQGVEGNGQTSNCGRTNKEGISFIKADRTGYERYLALYSTPQSENGCSGCRFFLMCKGQCPGTAIDGDWRNRTEHCREWMSLFSVIERRLILAGKVPLTIQPLRFELERRQIQYWKRGRNPSIGRILEVFHKECASEDNSADADDARVSSAHRFEPRITWVSEAARALWQPRLNCFHDLLEDMAVYTALEHDSRCSVRLIPGASFHRLSGLAARQGLGAVILPVEALPGGIFTRPGEGRSGVFLTGAPSVVAQAQAAYAIGDRAKFRSLLNVPECCHDHDQVSSDGANSVAQTIHLTENIKTHPLFAPLGISVLPVFPCRLDCSSADETAERWLDIAIVHGYASEVGWLRECLSWSIAWSVLNGITEIKTPLFKLCTGAKSDFYPRRIFRSGQYGFEGSASGLSFPYAPFAQQINELELA
jgi:uncharacterized protein